MSGGHSTRAMDLPDYARAAEGVVVALELGKVEVGIWASCGHLIGELVH